MKQSHTHEVSDEEGMAALHNDALAVLWEFAGLLKVDPYASCGRGPFFDEVDRRR